MIPPLPESNESPQERFKRYTKAILSVPKTEVETPEQAIARLKAEKRKIERMIAALNKKRKEKRNAVAHPSAQK
ncbi:MAG TPA: hypothetical protein VHU83_04055 [Bryobacteraceae bacterium]|jgi:hypothetical protein|nr:hypothetical protein [Bryobacteraceae bacterium]